MLRVTTCVVPRGVITVPAPSSDHRSTTAINGGSDVGQRRSTVVDHRSTAGHGPGQVGSWAGSGRVLGRVWIGWGLGLPRGATCQPAWQLTWRGGDYNHPA
ncbi:hypothetical protein Tco_0980759 [Tanacetum coccineum]